jgi:HAD superfamily hydrolase (TIGR01549 family)
MIKAVIFDLDGTISDFNLDYKAMRAEIRGYLLDAGVPVSILKTSGPVSDILERIIVYFKRYGLSEETLGRIQKTVWTIAENHELTAASTTDLIPGVKETLRTLKRSGFKLGLCTLNGKKSMDKILNRFKIKELFDSAIPREEANYVKPNPEHLKIVLGELEVMPNEAIAVGDSIRDIQAAKEINLIAVGFPSGISPENQLIQSGANYIITSITDMPKLIKSINAQKC